ncbi:MAG: glutamate synthase subunit alpha, partial [Candidatus Omnitrophota bacterium]
MSIVLSGRQGPFQKQGLYDPRFEHSACGVGFVCNIKGRRSHAIVRQGLDVLLRLSHRGATGADPQTGDGAGLLIQTPHRFFLKACAGSGISLPGPGQYGTGIVFLPRDSRERAFCKQTLSRLAKKEGAVVLGWREVPVDNTGIGETARSAEPIIEQVFVEKVTGSPGHRATDDKDNLGFERSLYIIRKQAENIARGSSLKQKSFFYITNISSRTFSYKGLLMPEQLEGFFPDLKDEAMDTALCLVHSRYSTNTFPTWDLAQPFRFLAHNGEINTLRGNINWMRAREGLLQSAGFSRQDIEKIRPIIVPEGSDSATIDNAFELLSLSGRSLAHTMMMLIPAAWEDNHFIDERLRGFYQYHSCLLEPWDGPAAIAFTDGKTIGAVLDRNGLRPARSIVTRDGLVVMASEVGVLDIAPQDILSSGRLKPGRIFLIDTEKGRIVDDAEIKRQMAGQRPYAQWVKENLVDLADLRIKPDTANSTNSPPKADAPPAEL